VGDPETLSRKLKEVDNNGWVDETLPLRMLHGLRDSVRRNIRSQGAMFSETAEEPVLPQAAFAATTAPEAPRTVEPTVEALPALSMIEEQPVVETLDQPAALVLEPAAFAEEPALIAEPVLASEPVAASEPGLAADPVPSLSGQATDHLARRVRAAESRRQHRRRPLAKAGLVASTVMAMVGGTAGVAFANAANPLPTSAGTATVNANKTVSVHLSGTWSWGPPAVTKGPQDCAGRYGLGWAVDWWGMSASSSAASIAGLTNGAGAALTPGGSIPSGGQFFHVNTNDLSSVAGHPSSYDGFDTFATDCTQDANGNAQGNWSANAVYPSAASIPPQLCVIMYDPHGKETSASNSAKDYSTTGDDDNSIQTNAFNPAGSNFCFTPHFTNPQTLAGNIFLCNAAGQQTTTPPSDAGTLTSTAPSGVNESGPSGGNSFGPSNVTHSGNWTVDATAPSGFHFVSCGSNAANLTGNNPSSANQTVNVPAGGTGTAVFYVVPNTVVQTLTGQILTCATNPATEVHTGTLSATGPAGSTAIPTQADPINAVPVDSGNWIVSATAPAGTQFVSSCGQTGNGTTAHQTVNVPPGQSGTATFFVTPNPNNPSLTLTKTADVSTVTAGNSFNWTLVAHNAGPGNATHAVVTDPIPNGLTINGTPSTTQGSCAVSGQNVTCTLGTLAANTSDTIVINVTANGTVCGPIINTGTLTTDQGTTQGSAQVTVNCPNFSINLQKSASIGNNATITAGTSFTYTLVATNTGGAPATGVVVTDAIPSQLTINGTPTSTEGTCSVSGNNVSCTVGTLAANNGSATITINVGTSTSSCGVVNNMGQVTATGGTVGNSNTVTTTIACAETVGITVGVVKTNNAQDPTGTDFGKTETAQTLGETFNYQAVITNTSTVTEVIGTITDTIAGQPIQDVCPSLVGQTLAPQASVTCTFQGVAPNTSGGSITDTVTVPVSQQGTPTNTGTGTDTSTVNTPPGVVITKASNAAGTGFGQNETVKAGSTSVPYQVTVSNPNSSPGTITSLTDTIGGTTTNICPDLIGTVLDPKGGAHDTVVCNFTTSVPTSITTDTAAVNLSVNGVVVPGSAQTTVFPPVLGTVITPATPAPALAFTGAPIGKMLASALGMIAMGLLLLFGLQVIDSRRRPSLRFAVAERGRRAGPVPTRAQSGWKGGNGYEQTATAAAVTWLADRIRSNFGHLRR
jgi:uncharacterized repeat protein (TIGR01451 family)